VIDPVAVATDLVVDSATGVEVHLRVAGPGARSFAYLIDWHIRVVLALAWFAIAAMTYNRGPSFIPREADAAWLAAVLGPAAAIYFLYHPLLEVAMRGSTPGKRMAGVRIAARDGGAPTVGALLARNVFRLIDSLPLAYGVGLLTVMFTRDHVRIGDLAAGTLLVYNLVGPPPPRAAASGADTTRAQAIREPPPRWTRLDPALESALLQRSTLWRAAAARAERLSTERARDTPDALALVEDYRLLARDLAIARRLIPDSGAREYLEAAYARVHAAVHRSAARPLHALARLFREQIPSIVIELRTYIAGVSALFLLSAGAGFALVHAYPDLIALFASPDMIAAVDRGELWTAGLLNVAPSSVISVQILTNNIVVSLFAFCAGFLFGLGTFYIVGLNGLTLGAVFAFTAQHGLAGKLFAFVLPHGCVELSVMCLSGAAGAAVGEALIRPQAPTRAQSFQMAARSAGKVLVPCVFLLVGCGVIEGYLSPDPDFPLWGRVAVGVGYWVFMLVLLAGGGYGRRRHLMSAGPEGARGDLARQHSSAMVRVESAQALENG